MPVFVFRGGGVGGGGQKGGICLSEVFICLKWMANCGTASVRACAFGNGEYLTMPLVWFSAYNKNKHNPLLWMETMHTTSQGWQTASNGWNGHTNHWHAHRWTDTIDMMPQTDATLQASKRCFSIQNSWTDTSGPPANTPTSRELSWLTAEPE